MPPPAEGFASRLFLGPALRAQPDRRLVTLVREGYEVAFEEIVRRYGRALGRYATAIVGSRGEDVTQDALSKALLALRRDDAEIELRPWLYRIVRNTALNDLRDRPPEAAALAETIASGRSLAEQVEQREELTSLIERLRALPEPQRAAIVMRELEGLSHDEIAAALGLSGGAARQAIYRARQALRDGAALLLPLPLLRLLIEHGGEAAAAGVGGGAVATAAGASAGGAGAGGVALKAGVVAAVLAGSVGTGVALRDEGGGRTAGAAVPVAGGAHQPAPGPPPLTSGAGEESSADNHRPGGDGERRHGADEGDREDRGQPIGDDDRGRHGGGRRGHGGPGNRAEGRHGPEPRHDRQREEHRPHRDDRSGPGGGTEERDGDHSGPGGGDRDDREGSSSGHGSGEETESRSGPGDGSEPPPPPEDDAEPGDGEEERSGSSGSDGDDLDDRSS